MKKILAISGSTRKNGTGIQTLEMFKAYFDEKYLFKTLHLSDFDIKPCRGCLICFKKGGDMCPLKDDIQKIIKEIDETHGIIFITPVLEMNVSSHFKIFLDRTAYKLHQPSWYDKHAFSIVTTDLAGMKPVAFYLNYMQSAYCMSTTGKIGVLSHKFESNPDYRQEINQRLLKSTLRFKEKLDLEDNYPPSLIQLVRFHLWRLKGQSVKEIYPKDYSHWEENNWLDKDYFYPIKINPIKKILLKIIKKRIGKTIMKAK